jgi:hypothetical protein
MKNFSIIVFTLFIIVFGCKNSEIPLLSKLNSVAKNQKPKTLTPPEYNKWIGTEENGFIKSKTIEEITFKAFYKPIDFIINTELGDTLNVAQLEQQRKELEGVDYFTLKIKIEDFNQEFLKYNVTEPGLYDQRVQYCAFGMQNDISLLYNDKDTVRCNMFHFERSFDAAPQGTFLLGFSLPYPIEKVTARTLIINDRIFNKGLIKLRYTSDNINIPQLKL